MTLTDIARQVFIKDRFALHTGIEITNVEPHNATCSLQLDQRHRNARGAVMGGVMFTLADFAAAVAANSDSLTAENVDTNTPTELHWVSLNANIHWLASATGDKLTASSQPIKHGRSTAVYHTVISSGDRIVATVDTTMMHV